MPSHLVLQGFSMKHRYFSFAFFVLASLLLSSCGKYDPLNDKNILHDRKIYESSDKFTLTVYYNNPDAYYDMALNPYEICDTFHSVKRERILYRIVFEKFMEGWFKSKPIIVHKKEEFKKKMGNIYTVCDIKNHRGDTLLWFTYDDPDRNEPYMILNGKLCETNVELLTFVKFLLYSNWKGAGNAVDEKGLYRQEYVIPGYEDFNQAKKSLSCILPTFTMEQKLELIKMLSE